MNDITFSPQSNGISLKQDSDRDSVFIYLEDLPELVKQIKEYVKVKKAEEKVNDVTIEVTRLWVQFKQDYDEDMVCVRKDELPKLIRLLQKIQEKG